MNRVKLTDVLSRKYLTAEITNAARRAFWIPVKYPIGNYFITDIEGQLYVFEITDEIKTWYAKLTQSFRYISYSTTHSRPLSPENTKELENVLTKNGLPKVNMKLFKLFKLLGDREKLKFEPHDIQKIIDEIMEVQVEDPEYARNMINFVKTLDLQQVVTPVKKVADFIQEDLLATNPAYLGNIIAAWKSAETIRKKVTNSPISGKKPWLKIIAIVAIIGIVSGVGYWLYDSGLIPTELPGLGSDKPTTEEITAQYSPEELKAAIDRGEVKYSDLPKEVQKIVDSVKLPTVD